jgi:hypothetical protein
MSRMKVVAPAFCLGIQPRRGNRIWSRRLCQGSGIRKFLTPFCLCLSIIVNAYSCVLSTMDEPDGRGRAPDWQAGKYIQFFSITGRPVPAENGSCRRG